MTSNFKYYKVEITSKLKDGSYETFTVDYRTNKRPADLAIQLAKGRYGEEFKYVSSIKVLSEV